jgi:predicted GNAT family acetyltransferase
MTPSFYRLTDKAVLETFFARDPALHLYSIGDLDDFFWPHTTWFATGDDPSSPDAIFLLYTGADLPVLLALEERNLSAARRLLAGLLPHLPNQFYSHLSPGLVSTVEETPGLGCESHGEHLKMELRQLIEPAESVGDLRIRRIQVPDLDAVRDFFAHSYPDNWFDPRMLQTDKYFGAYASTDLVGIAGVHVHSARFGVSALGNVTTHPASRGRGIAAKLAAVLCQDLLAGGAKTIGLNVKTDNHAAIQCYQKIGFAPATTYFELMISRRPTNTESMLER